MIENIIIVFFCREEDDQEEDDGDDYDYTELTITQLPNNVRHILNTIKDCKALVKYTKKVVQLFVYI